MKAMLVTSGSLPLYRVHISPLNC